MNADDLLRLANLQNSLDNNLLIERDAQIASRETTIAKLKTLLKKCLPLVMKDNDLRQEIQKAIKDLS